MVSQRPRLRGRHRVAALLYAATAFVSVVLGVIYLLRDSFMPYHAAALGKAWGELDPATQALLKALMEVAAGGWLALGPVATGSCRSVLAASERRCWGWSTSTWSSSRSMASVPCAAGHGWASPRTRSRGRTRARATPRPQSRQRPCAYGHAHLLRA